MKGVKERPVILARKGPVTVVILPLARDPQLAAALADVAEMSACVAATLAMLVGGAAKFPESGDAAIRLAEGIRTVMQETGEEVDGWPT